MKVTDVERIVVDVPFTPPAAKDHPQQCIVGLQLVNFGIV